MKVCHFTSVHPYDDTRIFIKECSSLVSFGYETHLIAPNAPGGIENSVYLHQLIKIGTNRFIRMTKTTIEVYKKALEIDADIYHFHDPELLFFGLLLRLSGKIVIYDVHEDVPRDLLSKTWIKKPLRKIISWIIELIENYIAKKMNAIVAATPYIQQRFSRLGCKCVNINNYPIYNELYIQDVTWGQRQYICYIGGISKIRGIIEIVQAIERLNIKLLLAGRFSSESLKEQVKALPGWLKVVELGQLNRSEVSKVMQYSIAGLVLFHPEPNHINSQPNKLYEYMSAGIPVVASNFPLWKELVERNKCGICVNPLNPQEIADAIQILLNCPGKAEQMGRNGYKIIKRKFSWELEKEKLHSLYEELMISQ